ncbi:hypothetical protein CR513_22216, partial [Mucuna pruriens]
MCDVFNFALGAILGQRVDKQPHVILYASRTMDPTQINYTTTEKELLTIEFGLEIRDKKGVENAIVDHLSQLKREVDLLPIQDEFPDKQILQLEHPTTNRNRLELDEINSIMRLEASRPDEANSISTYSNSTWKLHIPTPVAS